MRLKELDVLRGLAALSVVMFHFTAKYREEFGHSFDKMYDWDYGHYGVQLFFIISGFVIFLTILNVKTLKEFAYKRFTRLYPTYWVCLILTFVVVRSFGLEGREISTRDAVIGLTMFQGLFKLPSVDGAYWSLLPELLFYIFMGILFSLRLLSKIRVVGMIWLVLMIINIFYKIPYFYLLLNLKYGMFFLAGMLFYRIKFHIGDKYDHVLVFCCFITALLTELTWGNAISTTLIFSLFYLFVYDKLTFLSNKVFLFLGWVSYPLYLLHQNIGFIIIRELQKHLQVNFLVVIGVAGIMVFCAWLVTAYIEKPIMAVLRKRKEKKKDLLVVNVTSTGL